MQAGEAAALKQTKGTGITPSTHSESSTFVEFFNPIIIVSLN
jgi:hypothetical protein